MNRLLTLAAAIVVSSASALGQTAASTEYFLDNYAYIYRFNPALYDRDMNFYLGAAVPHITIAGESNVGASNILFPMYDGTLVTGLSPKVSAATFLDGLQENNALGINADINILSFGMNHDDNNFNFEVNLRTDNAGSAPKELFRLLKEGTEGETYTVPDFWGSSSAWLEAAMGSSISIGDFNLGFRLKALVGIENVSLHINEFSATPDDGSVKVGARGHLARAENILEANSFWDMLVPTGYGFGADLGVSYQTDAFRVDLSALDLGAINWDYSMFGDFSLRRTFDDRDYDIEDFFNDIKYDTPAQKCLVPLHGIINLGGRYFFNDWLSAGMFGTARLDGAWLEGRAGVTMTPGKALSFSASAGVSNGSPCFGAALNLRGPGVMLHLGVDNFVFEFTPQYLPVHAFDTVATLGFALVL